MGSFGCWGGEFVERELILDGGLAVFGGVWASSPLASVAYIHKVMFI